ncbi:MAG: VOC family protein [Pseudomonadota bacterium]
MKQRLTALALVVADYDEAIEWYTEALGFDLVEDTPLGGGKRWVVVEPPGDSGGCRLLLARATSEDQEAAIGNQTGGRVFLFLETDDFHADYARYLDAGVEFEEDAPREEAYGTVIVFRDLYGNKWDLIERRA